MDPSNLTSPDMTTNPDMIFNSAIITKANMIKNASMIDNLERPYEQFTIDDIGAMDKPCGGPANAFHRIRICGHRVYTLYPSPCGPGCATKMNPPYNFDSPKQITNVDFICPTCVDAFLEEKYEPLRETVREEVAAMQPTNPVEAASLKQSKMSDLTAKKEEDKLYLYHGHRLCEAAPEADDPWERYEEWAPDPDAPAPGSAEWEALFQSLDHLPGDLEFGDKAPKPVNLDEQMLSGSVVRANEMAAQERQRKEEEEQ